MVRIRPGSKSAIATSEAKLYNLLLEGWGTGVSMHRMKKRLALDESRDKIGHLGSQTDFGIYVLGNQCCTCICVLHVLFKHLVSI